MTIVSLREHPELLEEFVTYFASHWGHKELYRDCMEAALQSTSPLPQWFIARDASGNNVGGAGLITNDFISRMDLCPWLCALYVEESCRNRGIAGKLIECVAKCAKSLGYTQLYCATDHVGFYERYGFEYLGTGFHPWNDSSRIYKRNL